MAQEKCKSITSALTILIFIRLVMGKGIKNLQFGRLLNSQAEISPVLHAQIVFLAALFFNYCSGIQTMSIYIFYWSFKTF